MIKTVFFDIGGVMLTNGWGHVSRENAAKKFGIDYAEMDYQHDFIFNIYEIGAITLDEYLDTVVFNQPRKFSREQFKEFMFQQSQELPQMLSLLKKWKQENPGIQIISLNNEGRELNQYRIQTFDLHELFDAFISSCEVGMRKPDPGIYRMALGIAQREPGECYYFDDRPALVLAARKQGIKGFLHEKPEATMHILENIDK